MNILCRTYQVECNWQSENENFAILYVDLPQWKCLTYEAWRIDLEYYQEYYWQSEYEIFCCMTRPPCGDRRLMVPFVCPQ